jgi:hypothetical protein
MNEDHDKRNISVIIYETFSEMVNGVIVATVQPWK